MLNYERTTGVETTPRKLIKVAVHFSTPLLHKRKPNKNNISNFRPVSILNHFSKIYEKFIENQLLHGM